MDAGGALQAALSASQPPFSWTARAKSRPARYGQDELVAHHRRHSRHRRRRPAQLRHVAVAAPLPSALPARRFMRKRSITRVASPSSRLTKARRRSSKSPTASGRTAVHVRVLVLQGVAQLVGQDELVGGGEGAVLADRVEALLARPLVVEARDVLFQDARAHRAQVRARGQEVERDERALIGEGPRRRVLVVEDVLQVLGELGRAQVVEGDGRAERHSPRLHDFLLQLRARDFLEAEEAAQHGVDEVGGIGRPLLRAPRAAAAPTSSDERGQGRRRRRGDAPARGAHDRTSAGSAATSPRAE